jgi:hypothetical protein
LTGPIRGTRLSAEVKRFIVRAVANAKANGMPIAKSCEILMIDTRRVRRWIRGLDPHVLTERDLTDVPPIAKVCPHAITAGERAEIVKAARTKRLAHLRHRKLTHAVPYGQGLLFALDDASGASSREAGARLSSPQPALETASGDRRIRAE